MPEQERRQFQIFLPGLLKVLAESLYSTKKVAIRELLQNAHDSCVRRAVEARERFYKPRVDVRVDPSGRVLTIQDNGSGLTAEDVTTYLSTIGRSYTRELGENLSILNPDEAGKLIGQFGLGFLSAFLIAQEVTLTTRSYKPDSPTLQWRSTGDVHYDLQETDEDFGIGTRVELLIKPSAAFLLNERILTETVQQYADFLPIPIYVENGLLAVNTMQLPWEAPNPDAATRDTISRTFKTANPLAVIELDDQIVDLGHDQITIPLKGFLFIPPSSIASLREYGDLNIYIRRMFICEGQRDLLPPWARFVRGVVDCPYLQPTASREEIHQDDTFLSVQQALEQQLLSGLRRIAHDDPKTWREIVTGHTDVIMGWAVKDREFFQQVADIVTLRTSRGQLSLPEYLRLTGGNAIYYITRQIGSLQEQLLSEGHGVPVVDAHWFMVAQFLQQYAAHHPNIRITQLDDQSNQLLTSVPEDSFEPLLAYYRSQGIKARMVTFKPKDVPALIIYPKDAEFMKETRTALDSGELAAPLADFVGDYVNRFVPNNDDLEGTLYLNADCPLIRQLTQIEAEALRTPALMLIYQTARLFNGRMLDTGQITSAFRESARAIEVLIAPK
ncbi:MAG: ATP-binding protein [bacterium]|nr:ATP-binding protein [bacterium]